MQLSTSRGIRTASVDSGLLINRGSDDNYAFLWDESADKFIVANVGSRRWRYP